MKLTMIPDQYKSKEFLFTLTASILCFTIGYVTVFQKELFVDNTGSFKVFGGLWFILAIGIQLKWKYVRNISVGVSTISLIALIAITLISFRQGYQYTLAYVLLIITLVLLLILLLSKPVKVQFMRGKIPNA